MEFEKLGAFYLGKEYDLASGQLLDRLVMYDARDLTTHALCVGMTGSGKTGLCIDLLEEAAIDHVPALIIDPKGDITNLLLTFPELNPEDFKPWVNVDDARRKGLTVEQFASQQAELWRNGLKDWGQDGSRIALLRKSADFALYTPGSDAGIPVSILQSFAAPLLDWDDNAELLRERIQGTVSALLGLIGMDVDPVRSREHILLANLFEHFWRQKEDLDLRKLILSIQNPPMSQLGVFDVDTFFPQKERLALAMNLNNIIAAPGFQTWLKGQPLDIPGFLSTPEGTPRHSIFYIAHLSDAERMFFVTMLLNQVVTWMRTQPGTTSLRALLYMDEIFGFFPPVANPPSKQPMLTLLKQGRAFGLGVVLTTQNPVDLDYKGLTNTGTWLIGRLQTERDKMRVLDGLESASVEAGQSLDRSELSQIISSLGSRVFLLHNVHEKAPITFQTRWAMSYLRGPLTRSQVKLLVGERKPDSSEGVKPAVHTRTAESLASFPPSVSPDIDQVYLPLRRGAQAALLEILSGPLPTIEKSQLVYVPAVLGIGSVRVTDRKLRLNEEKNVALLLLDTLSIRHWEQSQPLKLDPQDLLATPEPGASFETLPDSFDEKREIVALKKDLADHLYLTGGITLLYSPSLKAYSELGESERDFKMRLTQVAREKRDEEVDTLSQKFDKRFQRLEDRVRKAEAALTKKQAKAGAYKREIAVSVGESMLGMFMGRRSTRAASTALSKYRQSKMSSMEAKQAEENVEALKEDIKQLEQELKEQTAVITQEWERAQEDVESVSVTPRKSDIAVHLVNLAWVPHWRITYKDETGRIQTATVPAFR
ncbi:MAG: hypothetical protein HXS52_06560 [Theionarchaea archaeon]|nr:hypothetical protein [Theionarchaea archaeon]